MDILQLVLFFLASLGLGLSLFFSVVLLRWKRPFLLANQVLGLLLLLLTLVQTAGAVGPKCTTEAT